MKLIVGRHEVITSMGLFADSAIVVMNALKPFKNFDKEIQNVQNVMAELNSDDFFTKKTPEQLHLQSAPAFTISVLDKDTVQFEMHPIFMETYADGFVDIVKRAAPFIGPIGAMFMSSGIAQAAQAWSARMDALIIPHGVSQRMRDEATEDVKSTVSSAIKAAGATLASSTVINKDNKDLDQDGLNP